LALALAGRIGLDMALVVPDRAQPAQAGRAPTIKA
jgi:hypothetical protein